MVQGPIHDVTVGMPVYNDPDGLRRSVPTVFSQSWPGHVRLLLVDDGSDRETVDVITSLAATYPDIEVIRNERNRGRPHARNQILEHAGDGYLAWLDAGDLWHPRKLELQLAALAAAEGASTDQPVICVCSLRRFFLDRNTSSLMVPDVEGDQLYNAMTGRLFAYLPTMVGRVDAFRQLGFDERLLRRQDYDLLVRFLASGGRIVSTTPDLPLFTYLKSDVGANAKVVAQVNRVIRAKHAPYYRRYGPQVASEVKRNQHHLVARFHAANGASLQASAYRWLVRLSGPAPLRRQLRRVLGRVLGPLRGPLTRLAPVAANVPGLVRILDRLGLVDVARRKLARPGTADAEIEDTTPSELRNIRSLVRAGEQRRAIDELEAVVAANQPASTDAWLLLEEAYRRDGRLHSANETLDRGLAQHPGDHRLRARLVELSGLRHDWEVCIEAWTALIGDGPSDAILTSTTFRRAARSFRALERYEEAHETARAGLRRWPGDERLHDERCQSRALTVDWSSAVVATGGSPGLDGVAGGVITDLGFLREGAGPIEGDVPLRVQGAPRVSLLLNGRELATTVAAPDPKTPAPVGRFSLNCRDVLDYVGDGDVLSIQCAGAPVLTPDGKPRLVMAPGYESRSAQLFERLDAGYVFMKFGRLALGNSPSRKRAILDLYAEVASFFEQELGHVLFPFYGNLLGAIRDHDFIEHDVGGFDVAFVSDHADPAAVRGELMEITRRLAAHDYYVELHPWSVYVRRARGDKVFIDVNFAWFDPADELHASYGWRYQPITDRAGFFRPRQGAINGRLVPVPGNAEAILEQLYGEYWAIPMQGFDPDAGITRDDRYLMTPSEMETLEAENPDRIRVRSVLTSAGEVVYVG